MPSLLDTLVPLEFRRAVTPPLKRFYLCVLLASFGFGLTLAMFVVYLHNVRHFSVTFATGALLFTAVVSLFATPAIGSLTDRFGPIKVMITMALLSSAAEATWAFARTWWIVLLTAIGVNLAGAGVFGPGNVLLARLVDPAHQQRAFGVNFMVVNVGVGLGGLVSATVVSLSHPATFTALYLGGASTTFGLAVLLFSLRQHGHAEPRDEEMQTTKEGGWREVLADRRLRAYMLASLVIAIGGYGSLDAGFSLYVVNNLHLSVHVVGLSFFCNTVTIVVAQLVVLNKIEGRSRTKVMALAGMLWGMFWAILAICHLLPGPVAVVALCLGMAIFALGETVMSPVGPAIVNALAPEQLRGRYNAASGLTFSLAFTAAPAITAAVFALKLGEFWPILIAAAAVFGSMLLLNLRRHLTPAQDGLGDLDLAPSAG